MNIEDQKLAVKRGREDPVWWISEILGDKPWDKQAEILSQITNKRQTAIRSCNGAGKSWLMGRVAVWFLNTHPHSIVITTAPTGRQVRAILWKEIRSAHANSTFPLGGTVLTQEYKIAPDWFAIGFTASDATKFQGFHADHVLIVVDEAAGVPLEIYEGIEGIMAAGNAHMVEIGNPTDPDSEFANSFKQAGVQKFKISAFETPNFTAFDIRQEDMLNGKWIEKIGGQELPSPHLITPEWVAEKAMRWGLSSPIYRSRVLAEFPEQGEDTLIPLRWIEQAQQEEIFPSGPNMLSCDVARFGGDETCIYQRRGNHVRLKYKAHSNDLMETAGRIKRTLITTGADRVQVDGDGMGAGVVDRLREINANCSEMRGGARSSDPLCFYNARSQWYWNIREKLDPSNGDLMDLDPNDDELASQLGSLRFKVNSRGQIQVESKEDMKKRGLASPDRADTVAMLFSDPRGYFDPNISFGAATPSAWKM